MNIKVFVKSSCLIVKTNMCFLCDLYAKLSFNTNFGYLGKGESSQYGMIYKHVPVSLHIHIFFCQTI